MAFEFDYTCIENEEARRLVVTTTAKLISSPKPRSGADVVRLGKLLLIARQWLPHGKFQEWERDVLRFSDAHARAFIRAAEVFGTVDPAVLGRFAGTALTGLAADKVSAEPRVEALNLARDGNKITMETAQQIINGWGRY